MTDRTNNLKLIQKERKSSANEDTPIPLLNRAKRLRSLQDAEKLISRATSEYLKGKISEGTVKTISYLCQTYSVIYKDFLMERGILDYISLQLHLYNYDLVKTLDTIGSIFIENYGIEEIEFNKIAEDYRKRYSLTKNDRKKKTDKILDELEKEKGVKVKMIKENDPKELKKLMMMAFRQLPESEKYDFIENQIMNEFYHTED